MTAFHEHFILWFYSLDNAFRHVWFNLMPYVFVVVCVGLLLVLAFFVFSFLAVGLQIFGFKLFVSFSVWLFKSNWLSARYHDCILDLVDDEIERRSKISKKAEEARHFK